MKLLAATTARNVPIADLRLNAATGLVRGVPVAGTFMRISIAFRSPTNAI